MKALGDHMILIWLFALINTGSCCKKSSTPPPQPPGCCDDIRDSRICFSTYNLFYPDCPHEFSPRFTLYTGTYVGTFTRDTIPSAFTNNRRTVFIVHGWRSSFAVQEFVNLKNKLLAREDLNVIAVEWKNGADDLTYVKPAANTRVMGSLIGVYANALRQRPGSNPYFWCIGHSLGAHSCGFSKITAQPLLNRITGLDPAGPLFSVSEGLTSSSAANVDIIHTSNPVGSIYRRGHSDFYVNGGRSQPGCGLFDIQGRSDLTDEEVIEWMKQQELERGSWGCSHGRAVAYMISSVENPTCYIAKKMCSNYNSLPGSCQTISAPYAVMGYAARRYNGVFYLQTASSTPYCATS